MKTVERRSQGRSAESRERLVEAAMVEFAARGFEGASTRSIARRAGMHQPQINYHFSSKEHLWKATVDRLFSDLGDRLARAAAGHEDPRRRLEEGIRAFVRFAADRPELNRIMVQEATSDSERLDWIVEKHVRPTYEALSRTWRALAGEGRVRAVDPTIAYYMLVGGASFMYVAAPEARRLSSLDPTSPQVVRAHADALVGFLLGEDSPRTPN